MTRKALILFFAICCFLGTTTCFQTSPRLQRPSKSWALWAVDIEEQVASSTIEKSVNIAELQGSAEEDNPQSCPYPVHTLLLSRHGDSIWNGGQPGIEETFTGWTDVPLSPKGVDEAKALGQELTQRWDSTIDVCFTSTLQRAQMTAHYCYWAFAELPNNREIKRFVMDYRLNERHYGTLQGFSKSKVEKGVYGHGSSTVKLWRRSWHAVPPLLSENDPRRNHEISRFKEVCGGQASNVPRGESLSQVAKNRIQPFIQQVLTPALNNSSIASGEGGTGLIVAHANSLRALIGAFVDVEKDPVALRTLERLRIPTGAPLVLKYQALPGGRTRVCDLNGVPIENKSESLSLSDDDSQPDLPVWPLGCLSKQSVLESY